MSDLEQYARYFPVGIKVEVGIPLPNAEVFKDWAVIHEIKEDLVALQLSRDILPANVFLHYGQILEIRGGSDNSGYCCRAIIVSEGYDRELLLRLIGEIVSDELREFYRIDAFLPIKYFVSHEQNVDRLHKQWDERRIHRQLLETDNVERSWAFELPPAGAVLPHYHSQESSQIPGDETTSDQDTAENDEQLSWDSVIPLAANISGGGLRVITHQGFEYGEYVLLQVLVPSPQRVVDIVGKVVFANRNYAAGSDYEYFNTGVQFVCIDERDRDAIVNYLSTIQLKRIRQMREQYLFRSGAEDAEQADESEDLGISKISGRLMLLALFFLIVMVLLFNYYRQYSVENPKGEIERTFENSIKKYRDQLKLP